MTKLWFSLLTLIVAGSAFADSFMSPEIKTVDGRKEVWFNNGLETKKLGDIEVIPKGTKFYNWTTPENSARWVKQGKIDLGEVDALRKGSGTVGGGFYVSADFWDSSSFGTKLVVFTTTQDVTALTNIKKSIVIAQDDWEAFNKKLAALGIDGVGRYDDRPTWFNFLNDRPLLDAKSATFHDFEASGVVKSTKLGLASLLNINSRVPLQDTPWTRSNLPMMGQVIDRSFDLSTLNPNDKTQARFWLYQSSDTGDRTPLTIGARELFKPEVITQLKGTNEKMLHVPSSAASAILPNWVQTGIDLRWNIILSRKIGIPYSAWTQEAVQPPPTFPLTGMSSQPISKQVDHPALPYAQTINEHLDYLNMDDFLSAIAQGRPIDKIYDTPGAASYFTRWRKAIDSDPYEHGSALVFNQALTGNPQSDYRDNPASSDGDIIWQGKKYFQVNNEQGNALRNNPFITPEFQTIADPNHPGKTIHIARYDYPTAVDFERFSENLSYNLKEELNAAKSAGKLNDAWAPETRALTKKMLAELATEVTLDHIGLTPVDSHYFLLSIHPFNEMNTETVTAISFFKNKSFKMFYRGNRSVSGKPDEALLMTRESFNALAIEDNVNTIAIQAAFVRTEAENPGFPKYFDVPEIWQVGRKIAEIGPDPAAFVQESKAVYSTCLTRNLDANLNHGGGR